MLCGTWVGDWNVRLAGVSVRWLKHEFVDWSSWEKVTSREEPKMTRVTFRKACGKTCRGERLSMFRWAVEGIETSGRTWRVDRKSVRCWAEELGVLSGKTWCVERKNVMTRWLQTWITELCFTHFVLLTLFYCRGLDRVCECDVLLLWSDWREKNRYAVKLWKLQR